MIIRVNFINAKILIIHDTCVHFIDFLEMELLFYCEFHNFCNSFDCKTLTMKARLTKTNQLGFYQFVYMKDYSIIFQKPPLSGPTRRRYLP